MLILERRKGTSVRIGDDIRVEVHQIRNRRAVKLAIRAPRDIPIIREELAECGNAEGTASSNRDHDRFRVTLIEDNLDHAELISQALNDNGISKIVRHSYGLEAIKELGQNHLAETKPSLILLDYTLPDMTGLDILSNLRSQEAYRKTPIVMLSATQDDTHVAMCLDRGANAFVAKDTEYNQLKASIGRITAFWTSARLVA